MPHDVDTPALRLLTTGKLSPWAAGLSADHPLVPLLRAGRPIFVGARNSGESGKNPVEAVIDDFNSALKHLAKTGIDVRHLAPSKAVLRAAFKTATAHKSTGPEGTFTNKFVAIDLVDEHGVYFLLSIGSGRKLDDTARQPFVSRVAQIAREIQPALGYTKLIHRWARNAWALGEYMSVVEAQQGFIGDSKFGIRQLTGFNSVQVFFETNVGQRQAEELPEQTRNGVVEKTAKKMKRGRAKYAASIVPPPGLGRVRMKSDMAKGASVMYLDTPGVAPKRRRVAYGLPEVYIDGEPVDQVANVRFALTHLGRPDWPVTGVLTELSTRGYSTVRMRSLRGDPAAKLNFPEERSYSAIRAIVNNLDVYESGCVVSRHRDFDPITITNVFPLDGPWAAPEDFTRIRAWLARGSETQDRKVGYTFSGLKVNVNGTPAVMRAKSTEPQQVYRFVHDNGTYSLRESKHIPGAVVVERERMGGLLIDAIAGAGASAVALLPAVDADSDPEIARIAQKRRELRVEWAGAIDEANVLYERAKDAGGAMFRKLSADYNEMISEKVAPLERRLERLDVQEDARRDELRYDDSGPRLDQLLDLVDSLRDPTDLTYRHLWRRALHDLSLTTTDFRDPLPGRIYRLRGFLRLGVGETAVVLPIDHSWITGPCAALDQRVDAIVDGLRDGVPIKATPVTQSSRLRRAVALRLGRGHRCALLACPDPRIVRSVMAIVHDRTTESDTELAERLGEPVAFVRRIDEIYRVMPDTGKWKRPPSKILATMYRLAAGAGRVHDEDIVGVVTTTPNAVHNAVGAAPHTEWKRDGAAWELLTRCDCSHDAKTFLEPAFSEPVGPICSACWRDRAGIPWPEAQYRSYVVTG